MDLERILLDIETQRDFFCPGGSCYSRQAGRIMPQIHRLFTWARANRIPVISTVLRVRVAERGPLAQVPHCVEGTEGEQKMPGTVLPTRINLGLRNITDLPLGILRRHQQVIFEKRGTDIFSHTRAERLITELAGGTFIICGAGTAHGIVQAAVGLRSRGFGVILAEDAVYDLDDPLSEMAYRRMEAKGVIFAPTREIVRPRPVKQPARFRKAIRTV